MANTCNVVRHGERGCGDAEVDELNIGVYTLTYQIELDGVSPTLPIGPKAVANLALGLTPHALPAMWDTYSHPETGETDVLSRARNYRVTADPQSINRWFITVTFRPPDPGEAFIGDGVTPINSVAVPVNREPIYWWDREEFTQIINHDKDGKAIQTYAESLYPDVIEEPRARGVLVVETNVKTLAEVAYYTNGFDGAVNSVQWTVQGIISPPRFALCREVSAGPPISEVVAGSPYTYFHLVFRFVFSGALSGIGQPPVPGQPVTLTGQPWDKRMVEMDDVYWKKNGGTYVMNADGQRQRFVEEGQVPLDVDGTRRADGLDPLIRTWRIRREVDFNLLPF